MIPIYIKHNSLPKVESASIDAATLAAFSMPGILNLKDVKSLQMIVRFPIAPDSFFFTSSMDIYNIWKPKVIVKHFIATDGCKYKEEYKNGLFTYEMKYI